MRIRLDVTLGMVVLADVLRVFLPSLITLFGRAGSTPAELMGLYALSWFAAAFLAVPLARLVPAHRIALGAGVLLLSARAALQLTGGGAPQLYVASAGLLAGLVWLVATAMTAGDARPALAGVAAGLAASTVIHAALDGVDLMWRAGPVPWLLLAVELALFAAFLVRSRTPAGEARHAGSPAARTADPPMARIPDPPAARAPDGRRRPRAGLAPGCRSAPRSCCGACTPGTAPTPSPRSRPPGGSRRSWREPRCCRCCPPYRRGGGTRWSRASSWSPPPPPSPCCTRRSAGSTASRRGR
nr:hypothetical protein GCM10020093_035260 [Planobispora longispora]